MKRRPNGRSFIQKNGGKYKRRVKGVSPWKPGTSKEELIKKKIKQIGV